MQMFAACDHGCTAWGGSTWRYRKTFPDTDPQYKGISSIKLLEHVAKLIEEKGYIVENIDATIIAQKPKMRPYIEEMEKNIATALHIDVSQVNVKATTEEGLGFTGTEQGISSQAICALTTIYESSVAVADSQAGCEAAPDAESSHKKNS